VTEISGRSKRQRFQLLDFNNVGDALPIRYAYPALIAASCDFNSPLSRSSAPNINHELETLEQVSIGTQQRLEHAYAIFAHDPPLLRFPFFMMHGSIVAVLSYIKFRDRRSE
jgi:hypothetical protein